jgi:hypothetical protein
VGATFSVSDKDIGQSIKIISDLKTVGFKCVKTTC